MRQVLFLLCLVAAPLYSQEVPASDEPCLAAAQADRPGRSQLVRCDRAIRQPDLPAPQRLAMLMNRGIALLRAGKLDKAESDFDLAIRSAPGLAEAWINKGCLLYTSPSPRD